MRNDQPTHTRTRPRASATRGDLTIFLSAKSVSDIGYALDFVCLSIFIWEHTRSAFATGLVSVMLYSGAIVGGHLAHRYGDRCDRRRAMISADLLRMVMLALLAILPDGAQDWWLYFAVFLVGTGRSVFEATLSAATPVLAGERTQLVNGIIAGLKGLALVIGMGLAAVIVPVVGFRCVFALDAASYALSAVVLTALRLSMREPKNGGDTTGGRVPNWPVLVAAGVAPLIVVRALDAFGSSSHQVGLPMLGSDLRPDAPTAFVGAMWSTWAAGLLLASFVLRPLATRIITRAPGMVFYTATIVMSVGFIGVFWLDGWWPKLAASAVAGLGDGLSDITFKQAVQRLPDELRGRAFGLSQIVINSGFMSGLAVTSVVLAPTSVPEWVLLLHGMPILAAAWCALGLVWKPVAARKAQL